ncbi:uncharacterized protein STEHIDRAFT_51041 [Stereum hirsutum FP-91666 SS1]|uniref:uncharacterized protein n=1 Tax=Stereum hirsutum (strain FP-91666) TaxID=721885 RepID=UPI000440B78B|nr:uncharacterized protein STEHIDRAFT_51041 [Stereum hirsutum FP-91666 SS1]EIM90152.1 hypothetical protein STEHIDRAFT_51041 [Stereum hirsutum FP-91666 SS1]
MSSPVENSSLLLDEEDGITEQFETCLAHIFAKYCTPKPSPSPPSSSPPSGAQLLSPPEGAYLTAEGLDEWARDTNGAELSAEEKEEIGEYMDVTEDGCLT